MTNHHRGFTLKDLVVGLVLIGLAGTFLLPTRSGSREMANRTYCASNLRQIGQAIMLYANENRGAYPQLRTDPTLPPTALTGTDSPMPFVAGGPQPNDVTGALYLLMRTQDIGGEAFTCPSSNAAKMRFKANQTALDYSNFRTPSELSYSFHNFYGNAGELGLTVVAAQSDFAVAADGNPGSPQLLTATFNDPAPSMRKVNSGNHDRDGQNVLYGDGHVEFQNNPFVGVARDNMYTYGHSATVNQVLTTTTPPDGIVGMPVNNNDSVLLPVLSTTSTVGVASPSPARSTGKLPVVLVAAGLLAVAAVVVVLTTRKRPTDLAE